MPAQLSTITQLLRPQNQAHARVCRHGDYYVEVQSQFEVSSDVTGRTLVLANQKSGSWRKVTHYQYHAWPDHGTLQVTGPIRNLCRLVQGHRLTGLPVVHCSAGEFHFHLLSHRDNYKASCKSLVWPFLLHCQQSVAMLANLLCS